MFYLILSFRNSRWCFCAFYGEIRIENENTISFVSTYNYCVACEFMLFSMLVQVYMHSSVLVTEEEKIVISLVTELNLIEWHDLNIMVCTESNELRFSSFMAFNIKWGIYTRQNTHFLTNNQSKWKDILGLPFTPNQDMF